MMFGGRLITLCAAGALVLASCGASTSTSKRDDDARAVAKYTSGKISARGAMWLDRLALDLGLPYSETARSGVRRSCGAAEQWHSINRHQRVNEDWIILARICNLALADRDWAAAQVALREARP